MIPRSLQKLVVSACFVGGINPAAHGLEVQPQWKQDCVGRMLISLPGNVDIAAKLPKDMLNELAPIVRGDKPYKFQDGQDAGWSSSGFMDVSHPITLEEEKSLDVAIGRKLQRQKEYLSKREIETGQSFSVVPLPRADFVRAAWRGPTSYEAYFYVNRTAIKWRVNLGGDDENGMKELSDYYQTLLTGLRPRPIFDVPKDPGVCVQYAFVRDDGENRRHVGITYRLKAHPDITIWLQDGSAARIGDNQNPDKFTAQYKAAFFWEQDYQNRRSFKSLWPGHYAFQPTTLAGQEGVKTFVELTRRDGETHDYGYMVAVRGDPDAKEDSPDLMLYVIQDSVNARKLGIEPLSKDAFLEMAETIAASVKRRPVAGR